MEDREGTGEVGCLSESAECRELGRKVPRRGGERGGKDAALSALYFCSSSSTWSVVAATAAGAAVLGLGFGTRRNAFELVGPYLKIYLFCTSFKITP